MTTNVALPGFGSLLAGRAIGYAQAALSLSGMGFTLFFGVTFVIWYLKHWSQFQSLEADPVEMLTQMWLELRWALVGIAMFAAAWCWALITSLAIVREAKHHERSAPPSAPSID